jgi:hypothetical protein
MAPNGERVTGLIFFLWAIGFLFTFGILSGDPENAPNDDWIVVVILVIAWPFALGVLFSPVIDNHIKQYKESK